MQGGFKRIRAVDGCQVLIRPYKNKGTATRKLTPIFT